ncbi:MAG: hypothetical protein D6790_11665, partial [Caldilineae bacterium]
SVQCFRSILGLGHGKSIALQDMAQRDADTLLIINQQNRSLHCLHRVGDAWVTIGRWSTRLKQTRPSQTHFSTLLLCGVWVILTVTVPRMVEKIDRTDLS